MAALVCSLRGSSRLVSAYSAFAGECSPVVLGAVVCSPVRQQKRFMSKPLQGRTVRIGCASGFWGDSIMAGKQILFGGRFMLKF